MSDLRARCSPTVMVVLLFFFMLINFADKAAIGLLAVPLMQELSLTPQQFGYISSSFFLLFAVSGIVFGFLANRFAAKSLIGILAVVWTLAQLPLAFGAVSVPLLIACRVLLGAGEGPAYPLALHACYKWVPNDRRDVPTAIIMQGGQIGMLLAGPVVTFLAVSYGWRAAFLVLGLASVVWLLCWQLLSREGTLTQSAGVAQPAAVRVPYRQLLLDPTYLGNLAVYWAAYWVVALVFTWVPAYLQQALGYTQTQSGWMFSVFIAINIPIVLAGSFLSERLLRRGVSSRVSRGMLTAGFTLLGALLIVMALQLEWERLTRTLLLAIGCSLPQIAFVLCSAIIAEISPAGQRGAALSISNSLATTAGLLAPMVMGRFVGTGVGGYTQGWLFAAGVLVVGGLLCLLTVNPARSQQRAQLAAGATAAV